MKLHIFIATGGKPEEFEGMEGEVQRAETDASQVKAGEAK